MARIIIIVFAVFIALAVLGGIQAAKRRKKLMEWAKSRGLSFIRQKARGFDTRFPCFTKLREGSNRYAYNIMEGDWSGRPITAFDYHYETHSTDSKGNRQTHHHHFSSVIIHSGLPLKPLFIRPESFLDRIAEFVGFDDIDFESAEFSRKFYVKSEDRRWAYDVIHARTMQFLLDMPQFTIEFDRHYVIAYHSSTFRANDFENAANVVNGILERFPDYLVKQLKGN